MTTTIGIHNPAAAELAEKLIRSEAECAGQWLIWDEAERSHQTAQGSRRTAIAGSAMSYCADCPLATRKLCARRAEADEYTGFAAGAYYKSGRRKTEYVPLFQVQPLAG